MGMIVATLFPPPPAAAIGPVKRDATADRVRPESWARAI